MDKNPPKEKDAPGSPIAKPAHVAIEERPAEAPAQALADAQPNKTVEIQRIIQQVEEFHSHKGPLPTAKEFSGYEHALAGAADRILKMAESELEHRHTIEREDQGLKKVILTNRQGMFSRNSLWGMIFGFILGLIGVGGGIFLAYSGKELAGFSVVLVSTATLAASFITGHVIRSKATKPTPKPDNEQSDVS